MALALLGAALSVVLAAAALRMGLFDARGSALAGAVGIAVSLLTGIRWLLLLVLFVALGTVATRFALNWKSRRGLSESDSGSRSGRNVAANGGIPLLAVLLGGLDWNPGLALAIYAGAVSTATADTLSSEIGVMSRTTRLITRPWVEVESGVDGGISLLGQAWALIGAFLIAAVTALAFDPGYLIPIAVGGFLGCQADSIMGATLERRGVINNEGVNLLATALGGLVAAALHAHPAI